MAGYNYYQPPSIQAPYQNQAAPQQTVNTTPKQMALSGTDNTPGNMQTAPFPGDGGTNDIPYVYPTSDSSSSSTTSSWSGLPGWSKGFAKDWLSQMAWAPNAFHSAYNQYASEPRGIINDMAANAGQRLLAQQPAINEYMRPAIEDAARRGIGGGSLAQAMQTALGQDLLKNYWAQYAQSQNLADQMLVQWMGDLARMGYTGAAAIPAGLGATRESRSQGTSTSSSHYENPLAYVQTILGLQ